MDDSSEVEREIREILDDDEVDAWDYNEDNGFFQSTVNNSNFNHPFLQGERMREGREEGDSEEDYEDEEINEGKYDNGREEEEELNERGYDNRSEEGESEIEIDFDDEAKLEEENEEINETQVVVENDTDRIQEDAEEENVIKSNVDEEMVQNIRDRLNLDNIEDTNTDSNVLEWEDFKDELAKARGIGGKRIRRARGEKKSRRAVSPMSRRIYRRNRELDPEIKMMAEEANMIYLMKGADGAQEILEITRRMIELDPGAHGAWCLMGQIYEDKRFLKKATNVYLAAALIAKNNADLWKKVAVMSQENGNINQALFCYGRVVSCDRNDYDSMKIRADLAMGEHKLRLARLCYRQMLRCDPNNLENIYHFTDLSTQLGEAEKATPYWDDALSYYLNNPKEATKLDYSHLNIASELYILKGEYIKALTRVIRGTQCILGLGSPDWDEKLSMMNTLLGEVNALLVDSVPIEIKVRAGLLLTLLKFETIAKDFFDCLRGLDYDDHYELYVETGRILISKDRVIEGLEHLKFIESHITKSNTTDLWIAIGEGLEKIRNYKEAKEYYWKAENGLRVDDFKNRLTVARSLYNCHLNLEDYGLVSSYENRISDIRKEIYTYNRLQEQAEDARSESENEREDQIYDDDVADPDYEYSDNPSEEEANDEIILKGRSGKNKKWGRTSKRKGLNTRRRIRDKNMKLTMHNYALLVEIYGRTNNISREECINNKEKKNEFIKLYYQLYQAFIIRMSTKDIDRKMDEESPKVLDFQEDLVKDPCFRNYICNIQLGDWVKLILKAIEIMLHYDMYNEVIAMLSSIYNAAGLKKMKKLKLFFLLLAIGVCDQNRNYFNSILLARNLFGESYGLYPADPYSLVLTLLPRNGTLKKMGVNDKGKYMKYIRRHLAVKPSINTYYFFGHHLMQTTSNTKAIEYFDKAIEIMPNNPIFYLSAGINHFLNAVKKTTPNRHHQILVGFTYILKYASLRNYDQEAHFNLARSFHFLNLSTFAIKHYEKVLEISDTQKLNPKYDLKFEAAYNLSNIYLASNNSPVANYYRMKYLVV